MSVILNGRLAGVGGGPVAAFGMSASGTSVCGRGCGGRCGLVGRQPVGDCFLGADHRFCYEFSREALLGAESPQESCWFAAAGHEDGGFSTLGTARLASWPLGAEAREWACRAAGPRPAGRAVMGRAGAAVSGMLWPVASGPHPAGCRGREAYFLLGRFVMLMVV
jgi:hypothetical protein